MITKMSNKEIAKIAGVISGIAYNYELDPFWLRIGAVALLFMTCSLALLAYIVLAIVMPKEFVTVEEYNSRVNPVK